MISTYSSEYKALTAPQRAKVRKLEKSHEGTTNPISRASYAREQEVRAQAWKDLKVSERIEALESEYLPQMKAIEEQRKALWEQYQELSNKLADLRGDISAEPYQAVYADPQYKAIRAILKQSNEAHEAKMTELLASFKIEEVA